MLVTIEMETLSLHSIILVVLTSFYISYGAFDHGWSVVLGSENFIG